MSKYGKNFKFQFKVITIETHEESALDYLLVGTLREYC